VSDVPAQATDQALADFGVPKVNRRGERLHVVRSKGVGYTSTSRGKDSATGKEPQYNRPSLDDWQARYPLGCASWYEALALPLCMTLAGHDPMRVANRRVNEPGYAR